MTTFVLLILFVAVFAAIYVHNVGVEKAEAEAEALLKDIESKIKK